MKKSRKGRFTWKIRWPETGEITLKPGYAYPHTALTGARSFIRESLQWRERFEEEPVKVMVLEGTAEDAQTGVGIVRRSYEGTCKNFLKGGRAV